ncbi:MAG: hypothetical protein PHP82_00565 [Candidatus ainarchaeum sp.]|nr:hypothetical protein [Candidatus ainarchaeum sp.]
MKKEINVYYILDKLGFVEMKYYLMLSENREIIDFVLILFLIRDKTKIEILKYDYSRKEKFHIHKNYLKIPKKEYFDCEISLEEILKIKKEIQNNLGKYIMLYNQKEYI